MSTSLLLFFRRNNRERIINEGHYVYLHNCYRRSWIASNILGYTKIQLIGVSIPTQFEIIMDSLFSDFIAESSISQYEQFDSDVIIEYYNKEKKQI